jgi:hypothetical protein
MDLLRRPLRLEYERQKEKLYAMPETAHVSEIVLEFSPATRRPRSRRRAAEELRQRLAKGAPFATSRQEFSQGRPEGRGRPRALVRRASSSRRWTAAIFVNPPRVSGAGVTSDSIHVFRVTERKSAGYKPFSEVKEDLKKRISDDLYEKRLHGVHGHLRREAFVKIYDPDLAKRTGSDGEKKRPTLGLRSLAT